MVIPQRKIYLFSLLAITIFSGWLIFHTNKAPLTKLLPTIEKPNAIVLNVIATRYNSDGTLSSTLTTPKIFHFASNNTNMVFEPRIILYSDKEQPWIITSQIAKTTDKLEQVVLKEKVKLYQAAGNNNPEITITTDELKVYPKQNRAETDKPVTIYEKNQDNSISIIKSLGAKVDQKTGVIQLQSQARGYYAPST